MTRRVRKDLRWIIAGFVIVLVVACGGIFAGMSTVSDHTATVDVVPEKQNMVMSMRKPTQDRQMFVGEE